MARENEYNNKKNEIIDKDKKIIDLFVNPYEVYKEWKKYQIKKKLILPVIAIKREYKTSIRVDGSVGLCCESTIMVSR